MLGFQSAGDCASLPLDPPTGGSCTACVLPSVSAQLAGWNPLYFPCMYAEPGCMLSYPFFP